MYISQTLTSAILDEYSRSSTNDTSGKKKAGRKDLALYSKTTDEDPDENTLDMKQLLIDVLELETSEGEGDSAISTTDDDSSVGGGSFNATATERVFPAMMPSSLFNATATEVSSAIPDTNSSSNASYEFFARPAMMPNSLFNASKHISARPDTDSKVISATASMVPAMSVEESARMEYEHKIVEVIK